MPESDDDEEERREGDSIPNEETETIGSEGTEDDAEARRVRMLLMEDDDGEDDDDVPDFFEGVMMSDVDEESEKEDPPEAYLPETSSDAATETAKVRKKKTRRRKSSVTDGIASPILSARTRHSPVFDRQRHSISGPPQSHTFLRQGSFTDTVDKVRNLPTRRGSELRRQLFFKEEEVPRENTGILVEDASTAGEKAEKETISPETFHSEPLPEETNWDIPEAEEIVETDIITAHGGSENEPTISANKNNETHTELAHTTVQESTKPKPKTKPRFPSACINRFSDLVPPPPKDPVPVFHARMAPQRREIPPPVVKACTPMVHVLRKRAIEAEKNSKCLEEKVLDLDTKICILRDALVEVVLVAGGKVLLESWVVGKSVDRKEAHSSRKISAIEDVLSSLSSKIPLACLYQIKPKLGANRNPGGETLHAEFRASNAETEESITIHRSSHSKLVEDIGEAERGGEKQDPTPETVVRPKTVSSISDEHRSEFPYPPTRWTGFLRPQTTSSVPFTDRERNEEGQGTAGRSLPLATSPRSARRFNASCPGFINPHRNISTAPAGLKSSSISGGDANAYLEIHALQAQISKQASALRECIDALAEEQRQTDIWRRKYEAEHSKFEKWMIQRDKEVLQRDVERRKMNTWNANPLVCELVTASAVSAFMSGERVASIGTAKVHTGSGDSQMPIIPLESGNDPITTVPAKPKTVKCPNIPAIPNTLNHKERSRSRSPLSQTKVPKLPTKIDSTVAALPPKSALRRSAVDDEGTGKIPRQSTNRLENDVVKRRVEWKGDTVMYT